MKKVSWIFVIVFLFVSSAVCLAAAEGPSAELGERLFNNPTLGGAKGGVSCGTCHPGGKGLVKAGENRDLAAKVNNCIVGALKGKPITTGSVEMRSLLLYIKALGPR